MEEKKVYNGVIDWWKIVFCLIIVVMHVGEYYHGDSFIFIWGRYGVEFFFIVSGFFMAAHVMRLDGEQIVAAIEKISEKRMSCSHGARLRRFYRHISQHGC